MSYGIIARTQPRWLTSKPNAVHHVAVMPGPFFIGLGTGIELDRFFLILEFQSPFESTDVTFLCTIMAVSG